MAWSETLLEASFRGIIFDIVKTDDVADRALVEHSYPYVDGSDIEDMGLGARHISVDAIFSGDDYEIRLNKFLRALDGFDDRFADPLNHPNAYLVHPVFGDMLVKQAKYAVHHDAENPDFASVSVEFVESTPGRPFFERSLPVQKAEAIAQQGELAMGSASYAADKIIDRLRAANPLAGLDTLRTKLTAPILAFATTTSLVLSGLDPLVNRRAWGNDIAALVGSLLDMRDWTISLRSDWASIQSDLNAFSIFGTQPAPTPAQVSASVEVTEAQAIAAVATTIQINTAATLADAAGLVLSSEAATPTLSPTEIEAIANTARAALEAAIEQARITYGIEQSRTITEPLKDQGLAVQEAARAIIAARPPLILRPVDAPGNLRLLAHLFYGDHSRAAELYRLNGARSPFVNAGENVNAYAQ